MSNLEKFVTALRAGVPVRRLRILMQRRRLIAARARWMRFVRAAGMVH